MFRNCTGAIKLINFGYVKVMATASSTLPSIQSPASSVQGEHRHGSRKRKQDMPSSAAHKGVTVSSLTGTHNGVTVSPSSASHNGVNVTPSSASHNGVNVTPSSASHNGVNVTPSSASHNGVNVTPSSASHNGVNVTPSSASHNGVNVTPSSAAHNGVNVTPSSAAHNASTVTPSAVANQDSHGRMTQINTKSLQASISAVVSFNFPEDIVKRCAEDMLSQGKSVTASTLLQECESRHSPEFQQPFSYSEKIKNNNSDNNDLYENFIGAMSLPAYLNEGSSLLTGNSVFGSNGSHPATSRYTNREVRGESKLNGNVESTVANRTSHSTLSVSAQSGGPPDVGEDDVDGHLSSLYSEPGVGLNGWAQADDADSSTMFSQGIAGDISSGNISTSMHNGLHNSLGRSVNEISFPDHTERDTGSLRQHQYGGSGSSTNNSGSSHSYTHSSSSDLGTLAVSSTNNTGQAAAEQPRRGSMVTARHSFISTAEHMNTCFRLIEREHELLEKTRKCSQCFEKPREVTFLPCGHFTVCRQCADPIYVCPSCNKSILATVDTYLS